jgi:hypothetical protein
MTADIKEKKIEHKTRVGYFIISSKDDKWHRKIPTLIPVPDE